MRLLVCGGRRYSKGDVVNKALDLVHSVAPITMLIHGAATGADTLAQRWAEEHNVKDRPFPILLYEGGYSRNRRMLSAAQPDAIVFFPGGNGTRHMRKIAREAGLPVVGGRDLLTLGTLGLQGSAVRALFGWFAWQTDLSSSELLLRAREKV